MLVRLISLGKCLHSELFIQVNGIISYTSSKLRVLVGFCISVCIPARSDVLADISFSAFPHYGPCNISSPLRKHGFLRGGCLIYLFDQLPTLYFAVLMLSHLLDHFIFSSRRFSTKSKAISFGVLLFTIVSIWWWFKGVSFGITGPVNDNKRLQWRKVSNVYGHI